MPIRSIALSRPIPGRRLSRFFGMSHGVKDKLFTHQIEWTDGSIWAITALDISAVWKEVGN